MVEKKRQCGTCRFFQKNEANGLGRCTHPKRAGISADLLLLRPTELACRTNWGDSLWQDPADDTDPMKPQTPQQPTLPEPIAAQLQFDDEVTSVSIAGSKSSRSSLDDDVVDSGATATGMASWNDPVQEERLNLLRQSSHDALAGAHKRHLEKKARQRELIPFAEDDEATKPEASPERDTQQTKAPETSTEKSFPPDDFVETEHSAADESDSGLDDAMVDSGVSGDRQRSPRLRKLLREPNDPKRNEAMRMSMPSELRVTSNNPENREQWNSVPTLKPGFELPLSKPSEQLTSTPIKVAASAAPVMSSSYQPRPVSQARELISEDRLRQERSQRLMVAPLVEDDLADGDVEHAQSVTDRPRLMQAPSTDSSQIEKIKSSPLRGYHPATRNLTQSEAAPPRENSTTASRRSGEPGPQAAPSPPVLRSTGRSPHEQPRSQATPRANEPLRSQAVDRDPLQSRRANQQSQPSQRPYIPLQQVNTPFEREEIEISPNVPRCCGTCSSFKPGGANGRGSCTNAFAGPVQRVVNARDLACNHTYGSLWLPADERVWLKELPDHSGPTPLVDAMLARRRRRETTVLPDLDELTS